MEEKQHSGAGVGQDCFVRLKKEAHSQISYIILLLKRKQSVTKQHTETRICEVFAESRSKPEQLTGIEI